MLYFKVIILLTTCVSWSYCKIDKYCSICEDHTMCKYHGLGEECVEPGDFGVSEEDKKKILDVHNWLRRIIAAGLEKRGLGGPQPKAANLMKFIWDEELAQVAQRWADQCRFQHDDCRHDPRWRVGQNIYWKWKYPVHEANWTEAILTWYDEVSLYNPEEVESYRFEAATGHYTQILWHDTYTIGCGRRDYGANKLYVCNYGPAGNWLGERLYTPGEPCSMCPQNTFCDEYLCAYHQPTEVDTNSKLDLRTADVDGGESSNNCTSNCNDSMNSNTALPSQGNKPDTNFTRDNKTKPQKIASENSEPQIKPGNKVNIYELLLTKENKPKATTNTIEEDNVELDEETKNEIEEIKVKIENLLKNVIKKLRTHSQPFLPKRR